MADTYNFNYEYFIRRDFFQNFLDEKDEGFIIANYMNNLIEEYYKDVKWEETTQSE